ncbi:inorganic phosphate transporter [Ascoidea rubescens DSM 1968]|uniref:Phosphate transporter n=1 Tax=Ascoidea rubescens DSM 1968 TaxID=1344418 RepID=A0A1D2VJ62_9ASCO|nr:phosphate transporter [Ascoidea rubescens DSM 1968]ODV61645.1 phosphate transporter [Ascoidea rubescens DSM 1968]
MANLHDFDYIFAITMIFAFLDAWNIGANDVANSFASSVSSRSLTYPQAMILAGLSEFLGAVLAGSRVSETIRSKIIDVEDFNETPAVLMLAMCCAIVGSSLWLTLATSIGLPVSTTHSIVGGIIGAGVAAGIDVHWGWEGFAKIAASWFISPCVAGGFASIAFLTSKYFVLERKHDVRNGLMYVPVLVFITFSILTMLIVWKGSPKLNLDELPNSTIIGAIFGVGGCAFAIYMLVFYPYFRRKLVHEDWTLRKYDIVKGPIYWFKSTDNIPPMPEGHELVIDYYKGRRYDETTSEQLTPSHDEAVSTDIENKTSNKGKEIEVALQPVNDGPSNLEEKIPTRTLWFNMLKHPKQWPKLLWLIFIHGIDQDIISDQVNSQSRLAGNLKKVHTKAKIYNNKVEYLYSILQAITATTMSFAHGANDVSNAAGPLATVYLVWTSNTVASKADVPVWVLCYAAAALTIGLWTYGYNIMRNLGNRLILQSPSRGFSIELGAAVTVVMATQLALPVSTTQSAVGATVFVGLCNNDLNAVNWIMVGWCYFGWLFTLPCAGLVSGLLMAIILNAPRWGGVYSLS